MYIQKLENGKVRGKAARRMLIVIVMNGNRVSIVGLLFKQEGDLRPPTEANKGCEYGFKDAPRRAEFHLDETEWKMLSRLCSRLCVTVAKTARSYVTDPLPLPR